MHAWRSHDFPPRRTRASLTVLPSIGPAAILRSCYPPPAVAPKAPGAACSRATHHLPTPSLPSMPSRSSRGTPPTSYSRNGVEVREALTTKIASHALKNFLPTQVFARTSATNFRTKLFAVCESTSCKPSGFLGRLSPDSPSTDGHPQTSQRDLRDNLPTLLWYPTLATDGFTEVWDMVRFIASVLCTKEQ